MTKRFLGDKDRHVRELLYVQGGGVKGPDGRFGPRWIPGTEKVSAAVAPAVAGTSGAILERRHSTVPRRSRDDASVFSLRKWYLDCIASSGELCIRLPGGAEGRRRRDFLCEPAPVRRAGRGADPVD